MVLTEKQRKLAAMAVSCLKQSIINNETFTLATLQGMWTDAKIPDNENPMQHLTQSELQDMIDILTGESIGQDKSKETVERGTESGTA